MLVYYLKKIIFHPIDLYYYSALYYYYILVVFHPILLFRPILILHLIFTIANKLLLSFEFYPIFSRAGGKLLFWKNASEI